MKVHMDFLLPTLTGISLETSRIVADVIFPRFLSSSKSTMYMVALNFGAFVCTLALTQNINKITAPVSFLALAVAFSCLSVAPGNSTNIFMLLVVLVGLGTAGASVASSSLLQTIAGADRIKRTRLNATYRLSGVFSKIVLPVTIVMFSEHSSLFICVALLMTVTACVLQWLQWNVATKTEQTEQSTLTSSPSSKKSSSQHISWLLWGKVVLYCLVASLSNAGSGLVRALLHTRISNKKTLALAHSSSQIISVGTLMLTTLLLEQWNSRAAAWIILSLQASIMAVASFMIIVSTDNAFAAFAFVIFRSVEESAKLPNTQVLQQFASLASGKTFPRQFVIFGQFVATQKIVGSMLKMSFSMLSTSLMANSMVDSAGETPSGGADIGLIIATLLCGCGGLGLVYTTVCFVGCRHSKHIKKEQ